MNKNDFKIAPNSSFNTKYVQMAARLRAAGMTLEDIAYAFGMSTTTIINWSKKHPLFKRALDDGREVAKSFIISKALKAACGYEYTETNEKYNKAGNLISKSVFKKEQPPNPKLIMWLLCNMDRENWKSEHKITVENDKNINIKLDGKVASTQIEKLAGRLLEEPIPKRKHIDVEVKDNNAGRVPESDTEGIEIQYTIPEETG